MSLASIHAAHGETPRHTVQFYDREDFLYGRVAGFLAAGVMSGDSALVVATDEHRRGITGALSARGVDASAILFADAQATLDAFMRGDHPNGPLFRAAVRSLIGETRRPVRAYGEMVDLLCRANQAGAAVELEELWNDLCRDEPITLL
ncbi:MAG TPA: MEDS domain-containing protein, partial [Thermoanaerobaculia bacterium]|nr:MEDS domain-containing protein [Thermoanaerobaculia bacterium]